MLSFGMAARALSLARSVGMSRLEIDGFSVSASHNELREALTNQGSSFSHLC